MDPVTGLHVDLAGRYEDYSDFGQTEVGKVTLRYDFNPMIAHLRHCQQWFPRADAG